MSVHQFVTSSKAHFLFRGQDTLVSTSKWPIKQTKLRFWSGQSPHSNSIEMLWCDLKWFFMHRNPPMWLNLKQFCKEEWTKISPQWGERLFEDCPLSQIAWLQLLLLWMAQPVIWCRGAIALSQRTMLTNKLSLNCILCLLELFVLVDQSRNSSLLIDINDRFSKKPRTDLPDRVINHKPVLYKQADKKENILEKKKLMNECDIIKRLYAVGSETFSFG